MAFVVVVVVDNVLEVTLDKRSHKLTWLMFNINSAVQPYSLKKKLSS